MRNYPNEITLMKQHIGCTRKKGMMGIKKNYVAIQKLRRSDLQKEK